MYNKLDNIKKELGKRHRDKKYLEKYYIQERLNRSLDSYYKELEKSIEYLENRVPENVVKKM